jgi:hypothetical protein
MKQQKAEDEGRGFAVILGGKLALLSFGISEYFVCKGRRLSLPEGGADPPRINETVVPRYAAAARVLNYSSRITFWNAPSDSGSSLSDQPGVTASPPNGEKLASVLTGPSPALVGFFLVSCRHLWWSYLLCLSR